MPCLTNELASRLTRTSLEPESRCANEDDRQEARALGGLGGNSSEGGVTDRHRNLNHHNCST
jgi:hypothetical protein